MNDDTGSRGPLGPTGPTYPILVRYGDCCPTGPTGAAADSLREVGPTGCPDYRMVERVTRVEPRPVQPPEPAKSKRFEDFLDLLVGLVDEFWNDRTWIGRVGFLWVWPFVAIILAGFGVLELLSWFENATRKD